MLYAEKPKRLKEGQIKMNDPFGMGDWRLDEYHGKLAGVRWQKYQYRDVSRFQESVFLAELGVGSACVVAGSCLEFGTGGAIMDLKKARNKMEKKEKKKSLMFLKALFWYERAATVHERVDAMFFMGIVYEKLKEFEKAVFWYEKAANLGNGSAMCNLGYALFLGLGCPVDKKRALEMYQKSAEKGVLSAVNNIASMYERGDGVEKDTEKAVKMYREAAEKGDAVPFLFLV